MPWLLPLLGLSCDAADVETGSDADTSGVPEACLPPQLELAQEWDDVALPKRRDPPSGLVGVALGDLDGDGWLDALLGYPGGSALFLNDGAGALVELEGFSVDGAEAPWAVSAALADLDGDGDLDAHLGRWEGERDALLINEGGGQFSSRLLDGAEGATFSGAFADADGDGDLDLFVAAGADDMVADDIVSGAQVGDPNNLFLQGDDGSFSLADGRIPEDSRYGISFQGAWLDADMDGDLDVYVANDAGPFLDPNHLLLNDGAGTFTRATDCGCELEMFGMGAAVGDADGDGWPDVFVTDVGPPNLLLNMQDGTFVDGTLVSGAEIAATERNMTSWGTAFADMNQDGCQDLLVTYGPSGGQNFNAVMGDLVDGEEQPDVILWSDCVGGFYQDAADGFSDTGVTRAVAVGDLDRDGRPDAVTAGRGFMRAWRNVGGCAPGLTITLDAGEGNRQGVGARVEVTAGGRTSTWWMLPSTTGSSSAPEIYAGLGGASSADVRVVWPDGHAQTLEDAAAGSILAAQR